MTSATITKSIKNFISKNKEFYPNVTVKSTKGLICIDNLNFLLDAKSLAEIVTGQEFEYITKSLTRIKNN